jgi:hypothetical protein
MATPSNLLHLMKNILFSVASRFFFKQVLEVWIPGIVKVFRYIQVSVMPRFRLRQVSLYVCARVCACVCTYVYIYEAIISLMQSDDVQYHFFHPVVCIGLIRHPYTSTHTVSPTTPTTKQSTHLSHCSTVLNSTESCNSFSDFLSNLSIIYKRYCMYCIATGYGAGRSGDRVL